MLSSLASVDVVHVDVLHLPRILYFVFCIIFEWCVVEIVTGALVRYVSASFCSLEIAVDDMCTVSERNLAVHHLRWRMFEQGRFFSFC